MRSMNASRGGLLIVGAGHAGFQCVDSLIAGGWREGITLIDAAPHLPYQRPPLSKEYLLEDLDPCRLLFRAQSFYEDHGVDLRLGRRVMSVQRDDRAVLLDNGEQLGYSQLVLATGLRSRRLPAAEEIERKICYLRDLDDAKRIRDGLESARRIIVIGGGFNSLEVAAAAVSRGKTVTVLVRGERILAHAIAPELSHYLLEQHQRRGVDIRLGRAIRAITAGKQETLIVTDSAGECYEAELVVAGVGAVPDTELAAAAGLECEDGALVDAYCRTNDQRIYAVGDAARRWQPRPGRFVRLESVQNAIHHGKVVAAHLLGRQMEDEQVPWFWTDQYDCKVQMTGLHDGYDQVVRRGNQQDGRFSICYYRRGKLIAVHSVNRPADQIAARKLLTAGLSPSPERVADVYASLSLA